MSVRGGRTCCLSNRVFMEKVGQGGLGVLLASGYVMQTLTGSERPPCCVSFSRNDERKT